MACTARVCQPLQEGASILHIHHRLHYWSACQGNGNGDTSWGFNKVSRITATTRVAHCTPHARVLHDMLAPQLWVVKVCFAASSILAYSSYMRLLTDVMLTNSIYLLEECLKLWNVASGNCVVEGGCHLSSLVVVIDSCNDGVDGNYWPSRNQVSDQVLRDVVNSSS